MDSVGLESHTDPLERWPHTHCMVPLAIHHASEARCTSTRGLAFKHPCTPLLPAKVSQKPCSTCDPDSSRSPFADGSRSPFADGSRSPCAIPYLMGDLDFVDSLVSHSPSSSDDSPSNHTFTSPPNEQARSTTSCCTLDPASSRPPGSSARLPGGYHFQRMGRSCSCSGPYPWMGVTASSVQSLPTPIYRILYIIYHGRLGFFSFDCGCSK